MKALFIIPEYPPAFGGGIGTYYGALLPSLASHGLDVTAVVSFGLSQNVEVFVERGVKVFPLPQGRVSELIKAFQGFELAPDFCRHLAAAWAAWEQGTAGEGYDVVECTDWGFFAVPWLLQRSSPPLLIRCHGSAGQIANYEAQPGFAQSESAYQLVEAGLFPRASVVSTCGKQNLNWWHSQLNRVVQYCPPPYEVGADQGSGLQRSKHGLVVGRIQNWKGPETLCRALEILGTQAPKIDWVGRSVTAPSGKESYSEFLSQLFPDVWGRQILPLPPEPPSVIAGRQAEAGFVVVPSDWDVFNLTAAEAMSQKAVLICSDAAGASDLIEHGENGFIFKAGNAHQLAELIQRVQNLSASDRLAIGVQARQTVREQLNPDRIAGLVLEELKLAKSLTNRVPDEPDLLARHLTPASEDGESRIGSLQNLDRLDLKELIRYVARRTRDKLLRSERK